MTQLDASNRSNLPVIENVQELSDYLASGCKPKQDWAIGTEHEKFGFSWSDLKPLPYDGDCSVRAMLEGLAHKFSWQTIYEGENLIALSKDGASISLEPGGQFELSGAPLKSLFETCNEVNDHLRQVKAVAGPLGIGYLGMGFTPNWTRAEIPHMPKGRYTIMRNYMPKVGGLGLDMMHRTATVQVNLDFASEEDMVKKFRTSLALQPLATALFANSPFTEGKPNGWCSWRGHIWTDTDPDRTGLLDFVFDEGFGFERYRDYMLDVPMYFVYRHGEYLDATGLSFRDFLAGSLPIAPGQRPTIEDWKDHLSTAFPEVRLKTFLEMRGADSGEWDNICALPAFWTGILYDADCLEAAWQLAKDWAPEQRRQLREDAAHYGLKAEIAGRRLQEVAKDVLDIAHKGLSRRQNLDKAGNNESGLLQPLTEVVRTGRTLAEVKRHEFTHEMGGEMRALYEKYAF